MKELLHVACKAIDEKKGQDIITYEFASLNPFIDHVVICSATNLRQVYAIANNIHERVKEQGFQIRNMEGNKDSRWILIDLDSIVVHVFYEEERAVYQLEKLYADLKQVEVQL